MGFDLYAVFDLERIDMTPESFRLVYSGGILSTWVDTI